MRERWVVVLLALVLVIALIIVEAAMSPDSAAVDTSGWPRPRPVATTVESTTTTLPPTTTTTAPPPTTTTTVPTTVATVPNERATTVVTPPPQPAPSGGCAGWGDLIARYFGGEAGTACSVMLCESGGSPTAQNPSGASGLFQIMPGWADDYARVTGLPYYDGRFDGGANIQFAAWLQRTDGWHHWVCY